MIFRYIITIIVNQTNIISDWFYHLFFPKNILAKNDEILKPARARVRKQRKKKSTLEH